MKSKLRHIYFIAFLCTVVLSTAQAQPCDVIYVSTLGNNGNPGTASLPVASLSTALTLVTGTRTNIRMAGGAYTETSIVNLVDDAQIEGAFSVAGSVWTKSSSQTTTITFTGEETVGNVRHKIGLKGNGVDNWALRDLVLLTTNTSGTDPLGRGRSTYTIWLNNCSNYLISRCNISSGNAGNGIAGANGNNGAQGSQGSGGGTGGCGGGNSAGGGGGNGGGGGAGGSGAAGANGSVGTNGGFGGGGGDDNGSNTSTTTVCQCRGKWNGKRGQATACGNGGIGGSKSNDGSCGGSGEGNPGATCSGTGANGIDGSTIASSYSAGFYVPSDGTNGTGGTGGSGGSGGGGGAGDSDWIDVAGSGGSGGSGGGGGGEAGTGGTGGGSSFAIMRTGSGVGAVLTDLTLTSGTAGVGGTAGTGGNGGAFRAGRIGNCGCSDGNRGGAGGGGQAGGRGGHGGFGGNGLSARVCTDGVTTNPSTAIPFFPATTSTYLGCTNSEVSITKASGTWSLQAGSSFINDLTSSTSSYNTNSATAIINYTTLGNQDIVVGGTTYSNYIYIHTNRPLPTFDPGMPTTICEGQSFTMNTTTSGAQYEWVLFEGANNTSSPVGIYTTQIASFPSPVTGSTVNYHLRLRVRDDCCGWSAPVYFDFDVIPTSSGPIVTLDTVCAGETANLTTTGTGTLNWFSDPLGQINIASGPAPTLALTTPVLNQNTIFYAGQSVGACLGPLTSAEVIVNQLPNMPSSSPVEVCVGEDVILSGTGSGTGDLVFFNSSMTEISRTTMSVAVPGASFNAGALTAGAHTFYVQEDDGSCLSPLMLIGVTVNALPAAPTASGVTICSGQSTTLSATATGVVNWYADAGLTNFLGTGSTYTTGALTATTTYHLTQADANSCESLAATVTVTVDPLPANPTGTGATICAGNTASISATNSGGTLNWYSDAAGSNMIGTGSPLVTSVLNQNTTYFVQETAGTGCMSGLVAVTVTVNQLPNTPSSSPVAVCSGDNVIITATGSGTGDLVFYDNTMTEVGRVTMAGTPTQTHNAGALAVGNHLFYVTEDDGTCESLTAAIGATVNALPAAPTASGVTICSGNSATLTATATGTTNWYSDAGLTNLIGTGTVYMTGTLTATTDYYATQVDANGCESASLMVTVTVDALPADPTGTGATICSGQTASISATNSGGTLNWYSDAAGTNMIGTGSPFVTAALTQNTTYFVQETAGNGCMSSLVAVSVTVNALPTAPNPGTPVLVCNGNDVIISATGSGTGDLVFYNDLMVVQATVAMGGTPTQSFNAGALAAGTYTFYVSENDGTCESATVAVTATVNALPAAPTATGVTICSGNTATLTATATGIANWYSDAALTNLVGSGSVYMTGMLTTNTDYYLTQVDANGCESVSTTVTVTVDPLPTDPVATPDTACAGQTATLTATGSGGTLDWYSDASGTISVGTGGSFTTASLNQNTTYYVQETSAAGCMSNIVAVTAVVNALPGTPSAGSVTVCEGQDAILSATGSGTGDLVFYDNTMTEVGRVTMAGNPNATFNAGTLAAGNYLYYASEDNGTCESTMAAIGVTVNALPAAPVVAGTTICAGTTATLTATGSVSWYSDGALTNMVSSNNSFTTMMLSVTTDYYVVATGANGCTSGADTVTVTVDPLPATPTTTPDTICEGSSGTLVATGSGGTLNWYSDATGTTMVGTGASLMLPVVNQTTTYYVNETDATTGCVSAMAMATIVVNSLPNPPSASDVTICSGADVILSATGSGTGDLVFYDNTNTEIARFTMSVGNETGTHNAGALAVGNYVYFVAEDAGNCLSNLQSINVEVKQLPAAPTAFNDSPVCEGEMVFLQASTVIGATYGWTGPNGFSSTLQNFSLNNVTTAQAGTYDVAVTLDGCTSTNGSTTVTINARPVLAGALVSNSPLCDLDALTITAPTVAGGSYLWTGPNGFAATTQNVSIPTVTENDHQGFYSVVVTDNTTLCASLPLSTLVMITGLPDAGMAINNSPVCSGGQVTLTVQDVFGATYEWLDPSGTSVATSSSHTFTLNPIDTGTYTVVVTVNNCSSSYTTSVSIYDAPVLTSIPDTSTTMGTPLQLWAAGGIIYEWNPSMGLDNPNSSTPLFTPYQLGNMTYDVRTWDANGCTTSKKVNIQVNPAPLSQLQIVDLITPNGDGVNDFWTVGFLQDPAIVSHTVQIMSRGGMEVLNSTDYQSDWNGKNMNGKDLPDGTYWYIIRFDIQDATGVVTNEVIKGAVTIKR